jgi:energy-coupling factor transport system ATP-binding protein
MSSPDTPYVQVVDVGYRYADGTQALRGINLEVRRGEFLALIGQNGSGKTTLSKCINGLFKPTSGDIWVEGLNTRATSIVQMVRRVGYVFQNPDHQLFNATCRDEIAYGPRNIELPEDEVAERVAEAVQVVGLPEHYLEEHPFFLPKGLRQRVAIASILALRPAVIIVDEPTTGQDARQSLEIMDFLVNLNQTHGHTIIIITHDMPIVARYARRVVAMAQGEILADGPTATVFSDPQALARTSLAPPQITQLAQATHALGFKEGTLTVADMMEQFRELRAEAVDKRQ